MNEPAGTVDHLVIGGGPAGSMAAILLARAGRSVTLLEKERGPHHKVCGEFLSREVVDYLHHAGISPRELGAATIRRLCLSAGHRWTQTPLPFCALSLSRQVLDAALLERAADHSCTVLRDCCVEHVAREGDQWRVSLENGPIWRAKTVFLATGKHDLRGFKRAGGTQNDLVGFKMHWRLAPDRADELRDSMEVFLFQGGYGGLSCVEGEMSNLCLVVQQRTLRAVGGWDALFAGLVRENDRLRHYLAGSSAQWPRPLAISPIPYGYMAAAMRGLWCVGDQAAVIPSFTGDGMSIALHSAALSVRMLLDGKSPEDYGRALSAQLAGNMRLATWLSRAMVTRAGRRLGVTALSAFPQSMRWIAASTRIPARYLLAGADERVHAV
jgi:flavin-dependent dehydrogenase